MSSDQANHLDEQDAYSIEVFCQRNGISKSFYHKLQGQGLGPRTMRLGSRVLITREDARAWRKRHAQARRRHVSLDLNRLDGLLETFYKRSIENVDAQAGLLCVKIMERKAAMLGLDSPQQLDIVQVQAQKEPSQHEKIAKVINDFWDRMTPAEKALRDRLSKMDAQKALELLDRLEPNANGNGSDPAP